MPYFFHRIMGRIVDRLLHWVDSNSAASRSQRWTKSNLIKHSIFCIVLITFFCNIMYHVKVFYDGEITMDATVNFQNQKHNFTMPRFKFCISHIFQLNLLNDNERRYMFNRSYQSTFDSNVTTDWWPRLDDIVLRIRSMIGEYRNFTPALLLSPTFPEGDQTCFNVRPNVTFHARFPGAHQGIELILNMQTYEEIPIPESNHFTNLNIIPIMANEGKPNPHNRIHISPGRFSSTRLRSIIHFSEVRKRVDRKCYHATLLSAASPPSNASGPIAYMNTLQRRTQSMVKDRCVWYEHEATLTEAKLKYSEHFKLTGISESAALNMRSRLRSALNLQSVFDLNHRASLVSHLKELSVLNKNIKGFLDLDYNIACSDVGVFLPKLPPAELNTNIRRDMFQLEIFGRRFRAQVHRGDSLLYSIFNVEVPKILTNLGTLFEMLQEMSKNADWWINVHLAVKSTEQQKMVDLLDQLAKRLHEYYRLYELSANYGIYLKKFISVMDFNTYRQQLKHVSNNILEKKTKSLLSTLMSVSQCTETSDNAQTISAFSARGATIKIPFEEVIKRADRNFTLQRIARGYLNVMKKVEVLFIPNMQMLKIPSYVVLHCFFNTFIETFQRYSTDWAFKFKNSNAKYRCLNSYTLFVLSALVQDYEILGNDTFDDRKTVMEILASDRRSCLIMLGFKPVATTTEKTRGGKALYRQILEEFFNRDFHIQILKKNFVRIMAIRRNCLAKTADYKASLMAFLKYYKIEVLASFNGNVRPFRMLRDMYTQLRDVRSHTRLDISNHRMSIEYQLQVLQNLIRAVIDGDNEENLASYLDKRGNILMGAIRIQLAELRLNNDRFQAIATGNLLVIDQVVTLAYNARKSEIHNVIFKSVFERFFGTSQNSTTIVNQLARCVRKTQGTWMQNHAAAEIHLSQWATQISYSIVRAKRFVDQRQLSKEFLQKNLVVVHLFYDDFNVRVNRNMLAVTAKQMASQLGSVLGVYLGAGCPDILDLVILVSLVIFKQLANVIGALACFYSCSVYINMPNGS